MSAANLIPYLSFIQRSLPKEAREPLAECLGKALSLLQRKRRKMAAYNLKRLGIARAEEVSRKTILNWSMCVADQLRSLWFSKTELQGMVDDRWSYNLEEALARNRGVVLITAHLGNYELAGSYLASFGLPIHAVVEEIPGGHTDAVNRIRRRFGMGVIGYSDIHEMIKILRAGNILVLLADRNIGEKGIDVRFGASTRRLPVGPAFLALRTGALVQTGYFVRVKGEKRYLCVIHPALDLKPAGALEQKAKLLTRKISEELVSAIRSYPDQWFVFQNE
jgi:lauroyl/myristoyl acyltransferase